MNSDAMDNETRFSQVTCITEVNLPTVRGSELGQVFKSLRPDTSVLYLPKPFTSEALIEFLGRMISTRQARGLSSSHAGSSFSGCIGSVPHKVSALGRQEQKLDLAASANRSDRSSVQ